MKTNLRALAFAWPLVLMSSLLAQEAPQFPQPTTEHKFLEQFVGQWESTAEAVMGPGQPPLTCKGTASGRMLGGFWLIYESEGEMMGLTTKAIQTIGYDAEKKKYVGTWVDSMINYMWHYVGEVDESGTKLVLEAEGPNFMTTGKVTKFRDAYEFKSPGHIEFTSSMLGEDGKWVQFITGQIRRKK
jgi:hypothetical protein